MKYLTAKEFCEQVKALGITHLLKDISVYEDDKLYDKVLYAVDNKKELKGYYSPNYGGTILGKRSVEWSMSRRKFKKYKID